MADSRGKRYDPAVVDAFEEVASGRVPVEPVRHRGVSVGDLRPGMCTTRDLVRGDGSLLLSAEHVLTERMIRQIIDHEARTGMRFTVYVKEAGVRAPRRRVRRAPPARWRCGGRRRVGGRSRSAPLESEEPGITRVDRDGDGAIYLD